MTKGELISIIGLAGMVLSIMCLDSDYFIPAAILACGFGLMSFAGHMLTGESFIDEDQVDEEKIKSNRDELFRQWVLREKIK